MAAGDRRKVPASMRSAMIGGLGPVKFFFPCTRMWTSRAPSIPRHLDQPIPPGPKSGSRAHVRFSFRPWRAPRPISHFGPPPPVTVIFFRKTTSRRASASAGERRASNEPCEVPIRAHCERFQLQVHGKRPTSNLREVKPAPSHYGRTEVQE